VFIDEVTAERRSRIHFEMHVTVDGYQRLKSIPDSEDAVYSSSFFTFFIFIFGRLKVSESQTMKLTSLLSLHLCL